MIGMVILVVGGVFIFFGVLGESTGFLTTGQFILPVVMIFEFIGATVICVYGVEESETLTKQLGDVFREMIYRMDYDPRASRILKQIQEYVS